MRTQRDFTLPNINQIYLQDEKEKTKMSLYYKLKLHENFQMKIKLFRILLFFLKLILL